MLKCIATKSTHNEKLERLYKQFSNSAIFKMVEVLYLPEREYNQNIVFGLVSVSLIWIYWPKTPTYTLHYTNATVFPTTIARPRELCFDSNCEPFDCRVNTGIQTLTSTFPFYSRHIVCDKRTSEHMRKHGLLSLTNQRLECSQRWCMYYNQGQHVFLDRVDGVVESMKNCSCTKNNVTNGIVECYGENDLKNFSEHRCHGNKSEFCSMTFFVESSQSFEDKEVDKGKRGIYCPVSGLFF